MEEMESLTSPENYVVNPDEIWEKLKPKGTSRRFLGMVREIAKWRELAAQKLDRPRGHILKDQGLLEVAAVIPKSAEEFHAIRSTSGFKKSLVPELLEVIASAQTIPDSQLPEVKRLRKPVKPNENLVEMLKLLLKVKCNELNVAEKLVATSEDLTKMAIGDIMESVVSHGWRYDIFGKHAIALKNGNISLAMKDGRIDIVSNKS
jgi:ribonuclease D